MQKVIFKDLGRIRFKEAWQMQQSLLDELVERKRKNRGSANDSPLYQQPHHYLLFCEHPHVYTLGKSGSMDNLLLSEAELDAAHIDFHKINRGGDITYHGPGQIVGYPIFDMDHFFTDIHKYIRFVEEAVIRTLDDYGLKANRIEGYTGVWLPHEPDRAARKICAIGVHLSRWVTMHGFAFNINTDLSFFKNIIPCGISDTDKDVTSMALELGRVIDVAGVKERLKYHFSELFNFEFV